VNGGLARSEGRRVIPSAGESGEGYSRRSTSPHKAGVDRHETQGGERSPFNGPHIVKSGEWVVGPGL
jgi:hypothetical protein